VWRNQRPSPNGGIGGSHRNNSTIRCGRFFDYLIIDEAHEEKPADSAQGNAVGALAAAAKKVIALTETLIGLYAEHIRPLLFRLSPRSLIQESLGWHDGMACVERPIRNIQSKRKTRLAIQ
jgi:hypothetical protein